MRLAKWAAIAMTTAGLMAAAWPARATEPHPWLCRDKPVFSSNLPMTYDASERGGGRWKMAFMRFDGSGGHDGFTVDDTRDVRGRTTGTLAPGQWYAVGMYRQGNYWICAARASEKRNFVAGVVRDLCYGEGEGRCDVQLTVRDSGPAATQGEAVH
jgi:hypothetical protein